MINIYVIVYIYVFTKVVLMRTKISRYGKLSSVILSVIMMLNSIGITALAAAGSNLPEGSDGTSGGTGGTGEDVTATPTPTPAPTPKPAGPTRDPYEGEPYTDF